MRFSKYLAIIIILICNATSAIGMDFEDAGTAFLFSSMSGNLYFDGEPVAHATLIRTINFDGYERDRFVTDENGYFELPAVIEANLSAEQIADFSVGQEILVEYQGRRYTLWSAVKSDPRENSEARGQELEVRCDMAGLNQLVQVDGHPIFTPCRWDVETDLFTPGFAHKNNASR